MELKRGCAGEFPCPICLRSPLLDPVTAPCGHSFDQACLLACMHTAGPSASCPVCRKPLGELPEVSFFLRDAVTLLFPEETQRRRNNTEEVGLFESLTSGAEGTALMVIKRGVPADVNTSDDHERTALHLAAMKGYSKVCDALLDCIGFVETSAHDLHGNTALHYASESDHSEVVRVILQHRRFTEANARNIFDQTALHCAKGLETVQALLDSPRFSAAGATDVRGRTALHCAARDGNIDMCLALLEHPKFYTHIKTKDAFNCTAFDVAASEDIQQILASAFGVKWKNDRCMGQVQAAGTMGRLSDSNVAVVASM